MLKLRMMQGFKALAIALVILGSGWGVTNLAAQVYAAYAALDGSSGAPAYSFNSATNTGLSRDTASAGAQMSTAGTLLQRWLSIRGGENVMAGHIRGSLSGTPVISACGTATIIGTDSIGQVTQSVGGAACTLTFANAWLTAPYCAFNDLTTANKTAGTGVNYLVASSTTAVTVTFTTTPANGDVISYICLGT